jgi:hypothetical protein
MTVKFKHLDEARHSAVALLIAALGNAPSDCKMVLIEDLYGKLRLVIWPGGGPEDMVDDIRKELGEEAQGVWSDDIWTVTKDVSDADKVVYENTWKESKPHPDESRLRILDRYRSRGAWFYPMDKPPWGKPGRPTAKRPPIVAFYSFKGGVGRSTALAAFAIHRAREGERVAVIDADLDAPGIGTLLAADAEGTTARWGVADYLLERAIGPVDLRDYYHACRREEITGKGEILIIPSGRVDSDYLGKLARLDFEPPRSEDDQKHPFFTLLQDVGTQLRPHWLLVDLRAGLAETAGMVLGGFAHLHVLFGTTSEQSWRGLRLVIEHLGAQRVLADKQQGDCVMVHAMVPRAPELFKPATQRFADRARDEFTELYYTESGLDNFWSIEDLESSDAPHVPVPIRYDEVLADFRNLDDVAGTIVESQDYLSLANRILNRFRGDKR